MYVHVETENNIIIHVSGHRQTTRRQSSVSVKPEVGYSGMCYLLCDQQRRFPESYFSGPRPMLPPSEGGNLPKGYLIHCALGGLLKDLDCSVVYKEGFSMILHRLFLKNGRIFWEGFRQNALTLSLIGLCRANLFQV